MAKETEEKKAEDNDEAEYAQKAKSVRKKRSAKRTEDAKEVKELKDKIQANKIIIGSERVLKAVRNKYLEKVFLASNCPQKEKEEFKRYSALAGIPLVELTLNSEELGLLCKKSFFILTLGTKE